MPKNKNSEEKFLFNLSLLSFLLIFFTNLLFISKPHYKQAVPSPETEVSEENQGETLGVWGSQKPVVYISGGSYKYSSGGLIPLSSRDDPAVEIDTRNVSGNAKFELYEADRESLFKYLLYKKENEQVSTEVDRSGLNLITSFEKKVGASEKVSLPLKERGIYYLRVSVGDTVTNSYIVRSNIASVVKEAGEEFVFWSQDLRTKKSLTSGNVKVYNLRDKTTELSNVSIGDDGVAKTRLTSEADIALVIQDEETAVVPINLRYLNTGYEWNRFGDFKLIKRYFTFTDRPLYRPGDTVYFKSIIRDEDDVRYTIPTGSVKATIKSYSQELPVYERDLPISSVGAVTGEVKLPKDIKTGNYYVSFSGSEWNGYAEFDVQEFRKPEYFVELSADKREFVSGDEIKLQVAGQYFSGQPLANVKVSYKVTSSDYYDWEYFDYIGDQISDDYRYGWWGGSNEIESGSLDLDSKGQATISVDAKKDKNEGKSRVYSVEVHYQDSSSDQAFDRKNILVYPGEFGIYRKNYMWSVKAGDELSPIFKLHGHKDSVVLSGQKIKATIESEVYDKGTRNYYNRKFEKVLDKEFKTNAHGEVEIKFRPQKEGQYKYTLESQDGRGNEIIKIYYFYATDQNYSRYSETSSGKLSITPDKAQYEPGNLAKVILYSEIPDRDVFVSFDRERLNRYQVVKMRGNTAILDLPLIATDMPNIYLSAVSFGNTELESTYENIKVSAERMRLQVKITPDGNKYKPGDIASVDIETKDKFGNPISADVAVWAVDKAIFELENSKLGNIYDIFWFNRYENTVTGHSLEGIVVNTSEQGGGCFAPGTKILLGDGKTKNIEDIKKGDSILTREAPMSDKLVKAKVKEVTIRQVWGYLLINGKLKITDNHIILANGKWVEAASLRSGDLLATTDGQEVVESVEWHLGKTDVYNLEIEKYHTFFADGIFVHNQKGGATRDVLKDTAYWNPSVSTDASGHARITIKLPENLTTWTISAVAVTSDTKVGQQKADIVVTKDIIVRPILPNVLREGDEIMLSALVQNFTDSDKVFNVKMVFAQGDVEMPEKTNISIPSKGTQQIFWKVKPTKVSEESTVQIIAYEVNNVTSGDNILRKIPVVRFGFKETAGFSGDGDKEYKVNLHVDSVNENTSITLNLAPTVLGSLPASMNYLISYPYGCVEQTTSRFVPTVIIKNHAELFPDLIKTKDIDGIITKGISRLVSLQQSNGGWGWWYSQGSSYISAYVVEYLLQAKALGYEVDENMMARAKSFFENLNPTNDYDSVTRFYALTLLGSDKAPKQMTAKSDMNDFLVAMLVIANKKQGVNDNNANGYNELVGRIKHEGNTVYWDNIGTSQYFASIDATTAMGIRAILEAGGDRGLAVSAVNYLTRSRNKHYWSNSYATANVIRAIVDLSVSGDEQNPNYTYEVELDGKKLTTGKVTYAKQVIREISIPAKSVDLNGTTLKLRKIGTGQMYSTLVVEEFRTDRDFVPEGKALKVTREIVNDKDQYRSLGVGEVARIKIKVEGLPNNSEYVVVEDTLPSGMVPVIESFKNEQFNQNNNYYWGREYKADGVIFSNTYWGGTKDTLEYRARVINSGVFWIPPATAEMMYSPEVNGVSSIKMLEIEDKTHDLPRPITNLTDLNNIRSKFKDSKSKNWLVILLFALVVLVVLEKRFGLHKQVLEKYRALRPQLKQIDPSEKPEKDTTTIDDENNKPLQ